MRELCLPLTPEAHVRAASAAVAAPFWPSNGGTHASVLVVSKETNKAQANKNSSSSNNEAARGAMTSW